MTLHEIKSDKSVLVQALVDAGAECINNKIQCPFHKDKKPSGGIYPNDKNQWKFRCFVCDLTLDVIDVIQKDKGLSFHEACSHLDIDTNGIDRPSQPVKQPSIDWSKQNAKYVSDLTDGRLQELADELCVTPKSLKLVGYGWCDDEKCFTSPEFDSTGNIIGIVRRFQNGDKRSMPGGNRGLTIPFGLDDMPDPVFVVEGASDVAASLTLGITSIGRSTCNTSMHLAGVLKGRDFFIVGENDERPDGSWPGKTGAQSVAQKLAQELNRPVRRTMPPDEFKDIRDYLAGRDVSDTEKMAVIGCDLEDELLTMAKICQSPSSEPGPTDEISDRVEPMQWEPFPTYLLPEPVRTHVRDSAKSIGCDESYLGITMLSALAGSIGMTRTVRIKRDFFQPPIFWGMFVGESGTKKDSALNAAAKTLRKIEKENYEIYQQALAEHRTEIVKYDAEIKKFKSDTKKPDAKGSQPQKPIQPTCTEHLIDDITIESLAVVLMRNPRGVVGLYEELSCFLRSGGEYKSGRGSDDAKWLKTYDAKMLKVNRKSGDQPLIIVPHPAVSIAGGIQPGILRSELTPAKIASGCIARFCIVYPPESAVVQLTDFEITPPVEDRMADIFHKLIDLQFSDDGLPQVVKLSREAKDLYYKYIQGDHTDDIKSSSGALRMSFSKEIGRVARIALILHMVKTVRVGDNPADPGTIEADSMIEAIEFVRWFKHETRRVYQRFIYRERLEEINFKVLKFIQSKGGEVDVRDVVSGIRKIENAVQARSELDKIDHAGMGMWLLPTTGPGGGSPRSAKQVFRLFSAGNVSTNPTAGIKKPAYADTGENKNKKIGGETA